MSSGNLNIYEISLDDIIINGRAIVNVLEQLKNSICFAQIGVWCIVCYSQAIMLEKFKEYLKHVEYVSGCEWKRLSDELTKFIVASNVGYVSYVDS